MDRKPLSKITLSPYFRRLVARSGVNRYSLLIFVVGAVSVGLLTIRATPEFLLSADHFFFPRLAQDLLRDQGNLSDWVLISAPRFFPDMLFYFLMYWLYESHLRSLEMASYALVALQVLSVYLLCLAVSKNRLSSTLAGLIYLTACGVAGVALTSFSLISWHTGAFAGVLICLYLISTRPLCAPRLAALFLLVVVLVPSDFLVIPIVLSGIVGWWIAGWWVERKITAESNIAGFTVVAACVTGVAVYYLLTPNPFTNPVHASNLSLRSMANLTHLASATMTAVFSLLTNKFFLLASFLLATDLYISRKDKRKRSVIVRLGLFWLVSAVANEWLLSLGAWDVDRYRIMSINGSIVISAIAIADILSGRSFIYWVPLLLLSPALMLGTHPAESNIDRNFTRILAEIDCLSDTVESYGLRYGVSDFATANRYSVLSNGSIRLVPIRGNSRRVPMAMLSTSWLANDFNYVIADTDLEPELYKERKWVYPLSQTMAIKLFGEPEVRYQCGRKSLLIYPTAISLSTPTQRSKSD